MQINNLKIVPNWRFEDIQGNSLHTALLTLLDALQRKQKLTAAAAECDLSYRHAWNILQEAEAFFGNPVVVLERGRGARLSNLGEVLLQAHQRIDARLHTQMESLAMELNAEVHRVLADQVRVMRIYASHGFAVSMIPDYMPDYQAEMHFHGPEDALRALHARSCNIAGFHLPIHHRIASQQQRYQTLLAADSVRILRFIKRQQGLMVTPKKGEQINSIDDLRNSNLRFINRQPRSGTRELFDQLLLEHQINPDQVNGYENHEYTHSAVAAHVATGMAEVGFGVQAAAARFDLKFIPLTEDTYLWAHRVESSNDPEVVSFIDVLRSEQFQLEVNKLPGYQCDHCGESVSVDELLA